MKNLLLFFMTFFYLSQVILLPICGLSDRAAGQVGLYHRNTTDWVLSLMKNQTNASAPSTPLSHIDIHNETIWELQKSGLALHVDADWRKRFSLGPPRLYDLFGSYEISVYEHPDVLVTGLICRATRVNVNFGRQILITQLLVNATVFQGVVIPNTGVYVSGVYTGIWPIHSDVDGTSVASRERGGGSATPGHQNISFLDALHLSSEEKKRTVRKPAGLFSPSPFNVDTARRMCLYSYALYCDVDLWDWGCKYCQRKEIRDFQLHALVYMDSVTGLGMVGYNPKYNEIVVGFRGSHTSTNFINDLKFWTQQSTFLNSKVRLGSGFLNTYSPLREALFLHLTLTMMYYPTAKVMVTGHSLGGAMANILVADMSFNNYIDGMELYTFGTPRTGNKEFATLGLTNRNVHYRLVNKNDLIPHLPPALLYTYAHTATEIWFTKWPKKDEGGEEPGTYKICTSDQGEDDSCSNQIMPYLWSVYDHMSYFNEYETCTG